LMSENNQSNIQHEGERDLVLDHMPPEGPTKIKNHIFFSFFERER
jgi:hypothetical protein